MPKAGANSSANACIEYCLHSSYERLAGANSPANACADYGHNGLSVWNVRENYMTTLNAWPVLNTVLMHTAC